MSLLSPSPEPARDVTQVGSGNNRPLELVTFGVPRWRVHETTGVMQALPGQLDGSSLDLPYPFYFFRTSGSYKQFCVKFPDSDDVQILSTEP